MGAVSAQGSGGKGGVSRLSLLLEASPFQFSSLEVKSRMLEQARVHPEVVGAAKCVALCMGAGDRYPAT